MYIIGIFIVTAYSVQLFCSRMPECRSRWNSQKSYKVTWHCKWRSNMFPAWCWLF